MAKDETPKAAETKPPYTLQELRDIVAAGMSVTEARMLLDDGYHPVEVLELAQLQASETRARLDEANQARSVETALAVEKATNPSNKQHPGKSAMAYPEGDVARKRPQLPYIFLWNGYPQHQFQEELHWYEAELMVRVLPGEYICLEKDGRTEHKVSVLAERNANSEIEKIEVRFSVTREQKEQIPPLAVWLYQMVHAKELKPRESFMKGMMAYVETMYRDEEAKRVPAPVLAQMSA